MDPLRAHRLATWRFGLGMAVLGVGAALFLPLYGPYPKPGVPGAAILVLPTGLLVRFLVWRVQQFWLRRQMQRIDAPTWVHTLIALWGLDLLTSALLGALLFPVLILAFFTMFMGAYPLFVLPLAPFLVAPVLRAWPAGEEGHPPSTPTAGPRSFAHGSIEAGPAQSL